MLTCSDLYNCFFIGIIIIIKKKRWSLFGPAVELKLSLNGLVIAFCRETKRTEFLSAGERWVLQNKAVLVPAYRAIENLGSHHHGSYLSSLFYTYFPYFVFVYKFPYLKYLYFNGNDRLWTIPHYTALIEFIKFLRALKMNLQNQVAKPQPTSFIFLINIWWGFFVCVSDVRCFS